LINGPSPSPVCQLYIVHTGEYKTAHARKDYMPQGHFSSIEMEEIHKLHRLAFTKSSKIDSFGFIIQLEFNRVDFDMFLQSAFSAPQQGHRAYGRKDRLMALSLVWVLRQRVGGGRS
jgi:hypothetical protein